MKGKVRVIPYDPSRPSGVSSSTRQRGTLTNLSRRLSAAAGELKIYENFSPFFGSPMLIQGGATVIVSQK